MTVSAIIVTYNPDMALLRRSAGSLAPQASRLYIIDNGSAGSETIAAELSGGNVSVVTLGGNRGIAAATNAGLRMAAGDGADWIITSDQDTVFPLDYVDTFLRLLASCPYSIASVAAFVPVFHDGILGRTSPVYVRRRGLMCRAVPDGPYTKVFQAIASGMLVNMATLDSVGPMNESLFIDMVDSEWCWRANGRGFGVVCLRDLEVSHRLGDRAVRLGPWQVSVRSPVRHYYMTRNGIHLALRSAYLSLPDRILLLVKSFRFILLYPLLCDAPLLNLRCALRGLLDALRGRLGMMGASDNVPEGFPGTIPAAPVHTRA